jgi:hypothetical protein
MYYIFLESTEYEKLLESKLCAGKLFIFFFIVLLHNGRAIVGKKPFRALLALDLVTYFGSLDHNFQSIFI